MVLHAHLPYVRHPEQRKAVEERWFFEAVIECYLPLVDLLLRLLDEGIKAGITVSISPTLASMARDPLLVDRLERHLGHLGELLAGEARRHAREPRFAAIFRHYRDRLERALRVWTAIERDIVGALAALEEAGAIELITTSATHAVLPLVRPQSLSAAQIALGLDHHELLFGRRPRGFWLPECAYEPGLEAILGAFGVSYVFLEAHGILNAEPSPLFGVHGPVLCPGEAVACFARDPECSKQIWSATEGYPADPVYREFFRDVVSTIEPEALGDYFAPPAGETAWTPTGLKFHRITGATEDKDLYDPGAAASRAVEHAAQFVDARRAQVDRLSQTMDRPPVVVAPFDAELFGHWWHEGPQFLEAVVRALARCRDEVELATPSEVLEQWTTAQVVRPAASSWGDGGYGDVWLCEDNAWIYRHLYEVGRRALAALRERSLTTAGRGLSEVTGVSRRALDQALRELLLAQSSDWPFMIRTGTARDYAEGRLGRHLGHAWALLDQLEAGQVEEAALAGLEASSPLFPGVDILSRVWCSVGEARQVEEEV